MIFLPYSVWDFLLVEFGRKRQLVEQIAFLDGIQGGSDAVISTITFPNAVLRRSNFRVSAAAMSEAGKHLASYVRLAQVHTHPGDWVGHSIVDDDFAYSRHDGALSIVLPNFGKTVTSFSDAAVHVCLRGHWLQLEEKEKHATIQTVPISFDFRR